MSKETFKNVSKKRQKSLRFNWKKENPYKKVDHKKENL